MQRIFAKIICASSVVFIATANIFKKEQVFIKSSSEDDKYCKKE